MTLIMGMYSVLLFLLMGVGIYNDVMPQEQLPAVLVPQDSVLVLEEIIWAFSDHQDAGPLPASEIPMQNKTISANNDLEGWFYVTLQRQPSDNRSMLLLDINHLGASEWYLNGEMVSSFGSINPYRPYVPSNRPFYIRLDTTQANILAVRYKSNLLYSRILAFTLLETLPAGEAGIAGRLGYTTVHARDYEARELKTHYYLYFLNSLILVLLLTYSYVYYWQRSEKSLYFFIWFISLMLLNNTIIMVANWLHSVYLIMLLGMVFQFITLIMPLIFVKFIEWLTRKTWFKWTRETMIVLLATYLISFVLTYAGMDVMSWFLKIAWISLSVLLMGFLIAVWIDFEKELSKEYKCLKFIVASMIVFFVILIPVKYVFYQDGNMLDSLVFFIGNLAYLPLLLGMPMFWTLQFRSSIDNLQRNIKKAQELGMLSLEREEESTELQLRTVSAIYQAEVSELQAKALESEKKKRDYAFNEARKLQESMLPETIPDFPGFQITAYQKSAEEVGGDYYDFFQPENDSLYTVVGDATGHGMSAGIMVSVCKTALFAISQNTPANLNLSLNSAIKRIIKSRIHMALSILKLEKNRFMVSSAAMPPVLHYVLADNSVIEVLKPGLPLGAISEPPYADTERSIASGDIIMQYSDGIIELMNDKEEMFGIDRLAAIVKKNHQKTPEEIMKVLISESEKWSGDIRPDDDITLMIIKVQ